jgi:hypothetical protein
MDQKMVERRLAIEEIQYDSGMYSR